MNMFGWIFLDEIVFVIIDEMMLVFVLWVNNEMGVF